MSVCVCVCVCVCGKRIHTSYSILAQALCTELSTPGYKSKSSAKPFYGKCGLFLSQDEIDVNSDKCQISRYNIKTLTLYDDITIFLNNRTIPDDDN